MAIGFPAWRPGVAPLAPEAEEAHQRILDAAALAVVKAALSECVAWRPHAPSSEVALAGLRSRAAEALREPVAAGAVGGGAAARAVPSPVSQT